MVLVDLQLFAKLPLSFCLVVFVLFSDGGRDDAGEEVFCSAIFGLESVCMCGVRYRDCFLVVRCFRRLSSGSEHSFNDIEYCGNGESEDLASGHLPTKLRTDCRGRYQPRSLGLKWDGRWQMAADFRAAACAGPKRTISKSLCVMR